MATVASFLSRRHWMCQSASLGLGSMALASLLAEAAGPSTAENAAATHFAPRAKRVIYLFQSGAPSQMDLFDHKPKLADLRATELPDSIRRGQRLTGGNQELSDVGGSQPPELSSGGASAPPDCPPLMSDDCPLPGMNFITR